MDALSQLLSGAGQAGGASAGGASAGGLGDLLSGSLTPTGQLPEPAQVSQMLGGLLGQR